MHSAEASALERAFRIQDCPTVDIYSHLYCPEYADGFLLHPRASVFVTVAIPEQFRTEPRIRIRVRSTYARLKIDLCIARPERAYLRKRQTLPESVFTTVTNHSEEYAILLRKETCIAYITNAPRLKPVIDDRLVIRPNRINSDNGLAVKLHASEVLLRVTENDLPRTPNGMPYIDPSALNGFHEGEWSRPHLRIGDYRIIKTREYISMPPDCFARITSAVRWCPHSSAAIINPGSSGYHALEVRARKQVSIHPGMHVANLYIFRPVNALPSYRGRYFDQRSIAPKSL